MTPQQHLDRAEQLLRTAVVSDAKPGSGLVTEVILHAIAHALIAHAAEAGVPHSHDHPGAGEPGGG